MWVGWCGCGGLIGCMKERTKTTDSSAQLIMMRLGLAVRHSHPPPPRTIAPHDKACGHGGGGVQARRGRSW